MKKALKIAGGVLVVFIVLLIVIPVFFKEDIIRAIDRKIAESVNADVYFSTERVSVSLLKKFPKLTVSIGDFGIIGREPFAGDTLTHIQELTLAVNLFDVIRGKDLPIEGIYLTNPYLQIKVLADGRANYDITWPSDEEPALEDTTANSLSISVKEWVITQGKIIYDDKSLLTYMEIDQMDHRGTGDFTLSVFDMLTDSDIGAFTLEYDKVRYFNQATVKGNVGLNMDLDTYTFKFLDNAVKINDFSFGFDGRYTMLDDAYDMDITFEARESAFKNILSIVPGMYMEGFDQMKTDGSLAFDGFVKGRYSETEIPAFKVNLGIRNGMFQYPGLPTAVNNIQVAMVADNSQGNLDQLIVDISSFSMELGKNPVKGMLRSKGLGPYQINTDINARLDLADLLTIFPIEGTQLKGLFSVQVKANGTYDEKKKTVPLVDMAMSLANGSVRYSDYPVPLDNIQLQATVSNQTGNLNDTKAALTKGSMLIDQQPFEATARVENLDDLTYELAMKGIFDLALVSKFYPVEGMELSGKLDGTLETKGKMSDVDAQRFERLPTSGQVKVSALQYSSPDFPQGLKIEEAVLVFNPREMVLQNYQGFLGKSDVQLNGRISNYIGFALKENEVLQGNLSMYSKRFDTNEWMSSTEETTATTETDTTGVVIIPQNLDFRFDARFDQVLYDNLDMRNMQGVITMKNGVMSLRDLRFNLLGGSFLTNGTYDTSNPNKPAFDFNLGIQALSFKKSFETFNTVQTFAPIAQHINGDFSTNFKIAGLLGQDLMPVMQTLSGGGDIRVNDAALQGVAVLDRVSDMLKIQALKNPELRDIVMKATFKDGKLLIAPFDVRLANIQATVSGATSFTGELDYALKMNVPATMMGSGLAAQYTGFTGQQVIPMNFSIGGSYNSPRVGLAQGTASPVQEAVQDRIDAVKQEAREEVIQRAREALESLADTSLTNRDRVEIIQQITTNPDSARRAAEQKLRELNIRNPLNRKKNDN